jgi:hypothetical protein
VRASARHRKYIYEYNLSHTCGCSAGGGAEDPEASCGEDDSSPVWGLTPLLCCSLNHVFSYMIEREGLRASKQQEID